MGLEFLTQVYIANATNVPTFQERLKECDELRKQQEATCAQESRRAEALQGELAQVGGKHTYTGVTEGKLMW